MMSAIRCRTGELLHSAIAGAGEGIYIPKLKGLVAQRGRKKPEVSRERDKLDLGPWAAVAVLNHG
jgi:hypothetical protein